MSSMSQRIDCNKCGKYFLGHVENICPECKKKNNVEIRQCSDSDRNAVLGDVLAEIESIESISSDDCLWIPKEDLRKVLSKYFA